MAEPSVSLDVLLAANAVMAIACAFQAGIGFGFALIAVPFLVLLDPALVPGPMLAAAIVLSAWSAWCERDDIARSDLRWALGGALIGTVLGVVALRMFVGGSPTRVFGVAILAAVIISLAGIRINATPQSLALGGGIGGFMGAMVGVHGPPLAIVLQHAAPPAFRATMGAYFAAAYAAAILLYALAGMYGVRELALSAVLLPGTCAGMTVGPRLARFVDRNVLRTLVLSISALSAVVLLVR